MKDAHFNEAVQRVSAQTKSEQAQDPKDADRQITLRQICQSWSAIGQNLPSDAQLSNSEEYEKWLHLFNGYIEQFLEKVKAAELDEFIPFISSRADHETICVGLLAQSRKDRLQTLQKLRIQNQASCGWLNHFTSNYVLNRLLSWNTWRDAETWKAKYQIYKRSCFDVQRAGYDVGLEVPAFKQCAEMWQRLIDDTECPTDPPGRFDWHQGTDGNWGAPETDYTVEEKVGGSANVNPQKPIFFGATPKNPELVEYVERLAKNEPLEHGKQIAIAREITGEKRGNHPLATALNNLYHARVSQGSIRKFETTKKSTNPQKNPQIHKSDT